MRAACAAALGGMGTFALADGIGENALPADSRICEALGWWWG